MNQLAQEGLAEFGYHASKIRVIGESLDSGARRRFFRNRELEIAEGDRVQHDLDACIVIEGASVRILDGATLRTG